MAKQTVALVNFNRGVVDREVLNRIDIDRIGVSAEMQTNWIPSQLGPMTFRPGTKAVGYTDDLNDESFFIPFIFSTEDVAIIELGGDRAAFRDRDGVRIADSGNNAAELLDPHFEAGASVASNAGWSDISDSGGGVLFAVDLAILYYPALTVSDTEFGLYGTRYDAGRIEQELTITDDSITQYLRIIVSKNYMPITLYVATTTAGEPTFLKRTTLESGSHLIGFNVDPGTTSVFVTFEYYGDGMAVIDYCQVITQSTNSEFELDLSDVGIDCDIAPRSMRYVQSGDVVYVSNIGDYDKNRTFTRGRTPTNPRDKGILFKVQRRPLNSWSVVHYQPENGPFQLINTTNVTMTVTAAIDPNHVMITPSREIFSENMVGSLIAVESVGQLYNGSLTGADQWVGELRVTGVGDDREFNYAVSGTWSGTVRLQRSVGVPGAWTDINNGTTVNTTGTFNDGLDNTIVYYRVGIKAGEYTSGTADVQIDMPTGSVRGIGRVVFVDYESGVSSKLSAVCVTIKPFGPSGSSENWQLGTWSYPNGFPSAPELFEGRLWWCGEDRVIGSVSDNYESFDDFVEGDSGPIQRSIGYGPVETLRWMKGAQRLYLGGQTAEHVIKSSSFDEPVTPTNFSLKQASNVGSCDTDAIFVDSGIIFGQRGGRRVYELSIKDNAVESQNLDLSLLCPSVLSGRVKSMALQRTPETRVWVVLEDGTMALLCYNRLEEIRAWVPLTLTSRMKARSVFVLPGVEDDRVFVQAEIVDPGAVDDGRHVLMYFAQESECLCGDKTFNMDCCEESTSLTPVSVGSFPRAPTGTQVMLWADGEYRGLKTIDGVGQVDFGASYTNWVMGLPYEGFYKSSKLAYGVGPGSVALMQRQKVYQIGLSLLNTHQLGLQYGPDFDNLDPLPEVDDAASDGIVPEVWDELSHDMIGFAGSWTTDSRICLKAASPYCATVAAVTFIIDTKDK